MRPQAPSTTFSHRVDTCEDEVYHLLRLCNGGTVASIARLDRRALGPLGHLSLERWRDGSVLVAYQIGARDVQPASVLDCAVPAKAWLESQPVHLGLGLLVASNVVEQHLAWRLAVKLVSLYADVSLVR